MSCTYCLHTSTIPYTFQSAGSWTTASNWLASLTPSTGNNVAVRAHATIPNGTAVNVGTIDMQTGGSITLEDGAQLKCDNAVQVSAQKAIEHWTVQANQGETLSNGWYFIASPVTNAITPSGNITANTFDLYKYDEANMVEGVSKPWVNYKAHSNDFTIENGVGYLYANNVQTTLSFNGSIRPYDANYTVPLSAGWNLVGNPYTFEAYANQSYYKMNSDGTAVEAVNDNAAIPPLTGIVVQASAAGSMTFTENASPQQSANNGSLNIVVAEQVPTRGGVGSSIVMDNAIVSFNEGDELGKFYFGNNAKLYFPQEGKDCAIACAKKQGEMPLNFKATENGTYTITVNPKDVEMSYLHLIDNLTGADIDLLSPAGIPLYKGGQGGFTEPTSYTFTAKATDYVSRFRLVFVCGDADDDNEDAPFAFISNGNIIVNGEGALQVIDVLGRQIFSRQVNSAFSIPNSEFAPGVYVLRLINGENVKTQIIIIK